MASRLAGALGFENSYALAMKRDEAESGSAFAPSPISPPSRRG